MIPQLPFIRRSDQLLEETAFYQTRPATSACNKHTKIRHSKSNLPYDFCYSKWFHTFHFRTQKTTNLRILPPKNSTSKNVFVFFLMFQKRSRAGPSVESMGLFHPGLEWWATTWYSEGWGEPVMLLALSVCGYPFFGGWLLNQAFWKGVLFGSSTRISGFLAWKYGNVVFTQVPLSRSVSLAEPKLLCRVPSGFCRMKTVEGFNGLKYQLSRWWFQQIFSPLPGEMMQFDYYI